MLEVVARQDGLANFLSWINPFGTEVWPIGCDQIAVFTIFKIKIKFLIELEDARPLFVKAVFC